MEKKILKFTDIDFYKIAFKLSNYVWNIVKQWDYFSKDTVGKQYVKAIDSVSANFAEGFGRYGKKDKINFYRYSFGSIKESMDWTEKAYKRNLLSDVEYQHIKTELNKLPLLLNQWIKYTNEKLKI